MKKALIATNLIGFVGFLWNDIHILQELGYEIHFAANAETVFDEEKKQYLFKKNVHFYHIGFSSKKPLAKENLYAYFDLVKLIKKERFNLVHCHTPIAGFITRLAAKKFRAKGTKVIYTTHGLSFTHLSSKKQWIGYYAFEKFASYFTDIIIVINIEDYNNANKFACKDVRLINGVGVDTKKFHEVSINKNAYKKTLKIPIEKVMILSVGELSVRKNHQIIIKALATLENKDDYVYVICGKEVGGTGFASQLRKLAHEKGVQLILLGHRHDIPEIMHCSDIGAIPSVREGLGLAGIQSLSAEVPLVGTDVQGIKDYIIDGISGFLCNPYDEKSFADAIIKLSDLKTREQMQKECYGIAKKYDISISHKQMEEIYNCVL